MTHSHHNQHTMLSPFAKFKTFLHSDEGTVAIEAAGIIPLFLLMMVVFAETSKGNHVSTQVGQTAATVSDIISQAENMTAADIDAALAAGQAIAGPQTANGIAISVVGVEVSNNGATTKVKWARAINGGAVPAVNTPYTLPPSLLAQDGFVVVSETSYAYTPAVGHSITGSIQLGSKHYFIPRVGSETNCTDCNT